MLKNGHFDLKKVLVKIKDLGYSRIFLEAGLNLVYSFLNKNLICDLHLFISNKYIKKNGDGKIKKNYRLFFNKNKNMNLEKINLFEDKLITYNLK